MSFYRLYFMSGADRIAKAEDLAAADDASAMSLACERLNDSGFDRGELWQSTRLLSALRLAGEGSRGCIGEA